MGTPATTPNADYQYIKLPDGSYGKFAQDATDDTIKAVISKNFPTAYPPNEGLAPAAGAPPPKGTLPNKGDTGEGPIAKNLTSFETRLSEMPAATAKLVTAKHWPVIDSKNFSELGQDLKSLNPIEKSGGEVDYGASAANLLPLAVSGRGIGESPVGGLAKGVGRGIEAAVSSPKMGALAKTAATDALSHVPVAGRLVRRPSVSDYVKAARTPSAAPVAEAPAGELAKGGKAVTGTPEVLGKVPANKPAEAAPNRGLGSLQNLLEQSLGAKKLEANVPLRNQLDSKVPGRAIPTDTPEGHTPHDSSALRSSMYDAGAKEFHARATSGNTTYIYGDVSPQAAQDFGNAESKGKAFQQIKNNHPLVAKIVDGKRIAVRPMASDSRPIR